MTLRLTTFFLFLFAVTNSYAQKPQNVTAEIPSKGDENVAARMACDNQFAGTIASITAVSAQSNDIDLDTTFLCSGDEVFIDHANDYNLFDDPTPATQPGIGYVFYDCPPTANGPNLTAVINDPCTNEDSPILVNGNLVYQTNNIWIASQGANGDINFVNDGNLIRSFGGGVPVQFWFAPITMDEFATQGYYQDPSTGEIGPCVSANASAAFSVVYLNPISATSVQNVVNGNKCEGSFVVNGGYPEFKNTSSYSIDISLVGRPNTKGTVTSGPIRAGNTVNFSVPEPGEYEVTLTDGKSCGYTFRVNMLPCAGMEIMAESGVVRPGDEICVDVIVNNFVDVLAMQFTIEWDTTVLSFVRAEQAMPPLPSLNTSGNFGRPAINVVTFSWDNTGQLMGVTLPDGSAIFRLCFTAIGQLGDESPIRFTGNVTPIQISDSNGANIGFDDSDFGTIYITDQLLLTQYQLDTACFGLDNGGFTVSVIGGTAPYEVSYRNLTTGGASQGPFAINNNGGSFSLNNQFASQFEVTITDNSGVPETVIDTIDVPERVQLDVNIDPIQEISCFGESDGVLIANVFENGIMVSNPGPEYRFLWSTGDRTRVISNLSSQLYSVTLTDQFGCQAITNRRLDTPNPIMITGTTSPATCTGETDGSLEITSIIGGVSATGNFTIDITGPDNFSFNNTQNRANINNLRDGRYDIVITDDNGCSADTFLNIGAAKALSIANVVIDNVSCAGGSDGEITITGVTTPPDPIPNYTFSWTSTPPAPAPVNTATTSTLSNLGARDYQLTMIDGSGCQFDTILTVTQPDSLRITLTSKTDETCTPGNDGTATVNVTGGTRIVNYTYNWGVPGQTTSTATGLVAGNYTLTVIDDNNCQATLPFTIGAANGPMISLLENDTLDCANSLDGSLTVVASAGSTPIVNYSWSSGQSGNTQTTINNLAPGTYTVTVTSQDMCTDTASATVVAPDPIMFAQPAVIQSPTCPGDNNGFIIVFPEGGTEPYNIFWSTDPASPGQTVQAGLSAGSYTVTVSDANPGCPPLIQTFEVMDPPSIIGDIMVTDTVSCFQSTCDGGASVIGAYEGGNTGTFDFFWQSGESTLGSNSSSASMLCQGIQTVTITDGTCGVVVQVNIPARAPINVSTSSVPVSCNGLSDGEASVSVSGGEGPYTFLWDNMAMTPTITGLAANTYNVDITDANGCPFTASVTVTEPQPFIATIDPVNTNDVNCFGEGDGQIAVTTTGGNPSSLSYNWQNGIASPGSNVAIDLEEGTYMVTVTDARGCESVLTHTINQPPPIDFSLDIPPIQCFGYTTAVSLSSVIGGNGGPYSFSVDDGVEQDPSFPVSIFSGDHLISVFDGNNCRFDSSIVVSQPNPVTISLPQSIEIELGDSMTLVPIFNAGGTPIDSSTVLWEPGIYLSCDTCLRPVVAPQEPTTYTLTLSDQNGCVGSAEIFVDVDKNRNIYLPNAFSPNGDGINDEFRVFTGAGVSKINYVRVFDRWGNIVYETTDLDPDPSGIITWDGYFNGKLMDPAVFVYLVEVTFQDDLVLLYRGDITLMR
jgi:gliding motility-associated-like protein